MSDVLSYDFTAYWFDEAALKQWQEFLPILDPHKIVEIGSYEGRCASFLIESLPNLTDLYCIDTWQGGVEHRKGGNAESDMDAVEKRFLNNVKCALSIRQTKGFPPCAVHVIKDYSYKALAKMIASDIKVDLVYIDGSHQAPDVLTDAIMGWKIVGSKGMMIFDDYIWKEELPDGAVDILRCPKPAIDAFTNMFIKEFRIIPAFLYQLYIQRKN